MSIIEKVADVNNVFLSRRELVCDFAGLGGRLGKLEAVEMVTKEFELGGKTVIPVLLKTHVGMPTITGTFYVYEDEVLARKQVDPTIFARLEKARAAEAEAAKADEGADATEAEPAKADGNAGGPKADGGADAVAAEPAKADGNAGGPKADGGADAVAAEPAKADGDAGGPKADGGADAVAAEPAKADGNAGEQ